MDWATAPQYKAERSALVDESAAQEVAKRYAWDQHGHDSDRYKQQIIAAYLTGLRGQPNPYLGSRGGNFAAGRERAWRKGSSLREILLKYFPESLPERKVIS